MPKNVELPRETALALIDAFKQIETELYALRQGLHLAKQLSPGHADLLDESVSDARQSPDLLGVMNQKYDAIREMLYTEELDARAEKEIARLIAQLRPEDPLN